MGQVTARLPDSLVNALDAAALRLKRSRQNLFAKPSRDTSKTSTISRLRSNGSATPMIRCWTGTRSGVSFSIRIKGSAAKELARVPKPDRLRIVDAIDRLANHPFLGAALKGDLRGLRRVRVGSYRVMYEVQGESLVVLVVRVAHRRDAYRRRT